jgi:outer membrane protein assembly factor BamB
MYQTNGTIQSSPAVVDGKVFIVSDDGYLYCLDAYEGYLVWKSFINSDLPIISGAAVMLRSSPAVVDKIVYVGSVDGTLYALNTDNGEPVWNYETGGIIKSSPTLVDRALFFTCEEPDEGAVYKVDATTGTLIWRKSLPYNIPYIGGTDMQGTPTVADGKVFVSSNVRDYYALDVDSGETLWTYSNPSAVEFIVSSPIYVDGQLYIIDKFDVACLNATTGEKLWRSYSGDELYVSPSYANGKIYLATSQRHIFIIDTTTSNKTLACSTPAVSWSSPALVDGNLYIGNNDWSIYCFSDVNTNEFSWFSYDAILYTVLVAAVIVLTIYGYFKLYKKQ